MSNESITIVFSTRQDNPGFIRHLKETCGIENAEILQHINNGQYSLTELYNRGLESAASDVIIFCHDDVIFEASDRWGIKILEHFHVSDFGILGKAGTTGLTESGMWWELRHLMAGIVRHQGPDPQTGELRSWENKYSEDHGGSILETIIIDGLFFAAHRKRIRKSFDEKMPGFHFYDVDFSLANHLAGVKVGVIFDIQITHKSIGITNQQWEDNRKAFTAKWQSILPYHIEPQIQFRELSISCNEEPEVAVIIPAKKHAEILFTCIQSIKEKTRYKNYTIYIADTGSDVESLGKIEECLKGKTAVVLVRNAFNNPAMVLNDMARNHIKPGTGLIIFCHDDIQLINDAISRCVQIYLENRNIAGTIGVRLHLRDGSIQHAGIQLSVDRESQLRISYKGYKSYYNYYPGVKPDVFSNTGAFMAVDKDFFLSSGGFSEQYQQFLEDTEFNIRAVLAGRINYFAGDAVAYHHELEAENNDPEIMKKEYEDYLRLLEHIRQNADNPYLAKHITFIYT